VVETHTQTKKQTNNIHYE